MIIARYLSREVFRTLFAVTLVLLLTFLSQRIVRDLNSVAVGKIPTGVLLQLIGYEIPYLLSFLLPLGLYLGILLAYGRMASDNEIAILQLSNFGSRRIMRLTLVIAGIMSAVVLYLMLVINPWLAAKRQDMMASDEATVYLVQTMTPGRFQVSPDGAFVMYVEKLSRDRQLAQNVFLAQEHDHDDENAQSVSGWTLVLADQGYQIKDKDSQEQFFVMSNGYRYEGTVGQNDYKITHYKKYAIRIPKPETRTHKETEAMSTMQLWQHYDDMDPRPAAELQWRISMAISTLLLAMLAVPLSMLRPRQGRYQVLLPAAIFYIVYLNLLFIARHWVEQGNVPVSVGLWWVHGVVLLFIGVVIVVCQRWRK